MFLANESDLSLGNSGGTGSTKLVNDSLIEQITNKASTPVSLLVESLVQQLCIMLDSDASRSNQLYLRICDHLHQMNLIDSSYSMGEFEVISQKLLFNSVVLMCVSVLGNEKSISTCFVSIGECGT